MMQIIDYQEIDNSIIVGFKKYNFVVYGEIGIIEGFLKEHYLQKLYEQCKPSIDYESERYNQGLQNSIVTDLEGEEFIPELPKLKTLKLLVGKSHIQFEEGQDLETIKLDIVLKDQYNDDMNIGTIVTSSLGEFIEHNILVIPKVEEVTEVFINVMVDNISCHKIIYVHPYIKKIELEPESSLDEYLLDMDLRLSILELGL